LTSRWLELKKLAGVAKGFGFEMELLTPQEAASCCPIINLDGVKGAAWIPSDGYIDPTQLTLALGTVEVSFHSNFEKLRVLKCMARRYMKGWRLRDSRGSTLGEMDTV
jgi:glycine/D-amino acid oxidase-like deaminating enzyme